MSNTQLCELCGDCVDRYRAERYDELGEALNKILADLEVACDDGPANYALQYGHLRGEIEGLLARFGLLKAVADGLHNDS